MAQIKILKQTTLKSKKQPNPTIYPVTTSDAVVVPVKGKLTPLLHDMDVEINSKQDRLTAGEGININGNEISTKHDYIENWEVESVWNSII